MTKIYVISAIAIAFLFAGYFLNKDIVSKTALAEISSDVTQEIKQDNISTSSAIDMEKVKKPRIIGDINAPIRIDEIVSLSCSHCGTYNNIVYPEIKKNFIDTGLAYIVHHDYPTNAPALHAAAIARCLPEKQFFKYVDLLFKTQKDWVHDHDNYLVKLKQSAKLAGLSQKKIDACVNNQEIHEYLIKNIRKLQEKFEITSTPTFIINDGEEIISGVRPYAEMEKILNKYLPK